MDRFRGRSARIALAIAALFCLLAAPALGNDRPWEQARWYELNTRFLTNGQDPSSGQRWLDFQNHTEKRVQFGYTRSVNMELDRELVFTIQGSLIGESAHGLALEVRF
jgi:hypothetical protein